MPGFIAWHRRPCRVTVHAGGLRGRFFSSWLTSDVLSLALRARKRVQIRSLRICPFGLLDVHGWTNAAKHMDVRERRTSSKNIPASPPRQDRDRDRPVGARPGARSIWHGESGAKCRAFGRTSCAALRCGRRSGPGCFTSVVESERAGTAERGFSEASEAGRRARLSEGNSPSVSGDQARRSPPRLCRVSVAPGWAATGIIAILFA